MSETIEREITMPVTKQRSWSYSTLKLFEQCAFKYKCVKLDKLPDPPSFAVLKGFEAHEHAEGYLKGEKDFHNALAHFANEFRNLKKHEAKPERGLVLDKDWNVIGEDDAWLHENAWLRLKIDASVHNTVIDFKTGKVYPDHKHQGELYAMAALIAHPEYDVIDVEFWYLNHGEVRDWQYSRDELPGLIAKWQARVDKLMTATTFPATKNEYCKYCTFKGICPEFKK